MPGEKDEPERKPSAVCKGNTIECVGGGEVGVGGGRGGKGRDPRPQEA